MSSSSKPVLKVAPCSHEAAKYAVENWHYSRSMPKSKLVKFGAWEDGRYIGCVIYGMGATPNLCKPYGLNMQQACELVRVALTAHSTHTSRIVAITLRELKKSNPGIKLVVSYADKDQGHAGGIYQAGNWVFTGHVNDGTRGAFIINGKKTHPRTIGLMGGVQSISWVRKHLDPNATEFITSGKYKYLYPLDQDMKRRIEPLRKPYPKRAGSIAGDAPDFQSGEGGSIPTPALKTATEQP